MIHVPTRPNLIRPGGFEKPLWPYTINLDSPQANGLAVWYPFIPWGPDAWDMSLTHQYTADNAASVPWVADSRFGMVPEFTGSSSHVMVSSVAPVSAKPMTICVWGYYPTPTTTYGVVFVYLNSDTSNRCGIFNTSSLNRIGCQDLGLTSYKENITWNEWHHAVGVFTSNTHRQCWVDGEAQTASTDTSTTNSYDRISLGARKDALYFYGRLGDVRIYNRALSPQECVEQYNNWQELYKPIGPGSLYNYMASGEAPASVAPQYMMLDRQRRAG